MLRFYRTIIALFIGLFISIGLFAYFSYSAPLLSNYYLGTLPTDTNSIAKLAKNDLLILSPEQAIVRADVIAQIKRLNPNIILLAYVPSESYNTAWESHPANVLYKDFAMQNDWWLRDAGGNIISDWPGLKSANMSRGWSDYMINFVKTKILSHGIWDGIFWDMVYDGISSKNSGNVDLNGDGVRDDPTFLNREWISRVEYLLQKSQNEFKTKYIIINGSSVPAYQPLVNGRMYEDYPTPWEGTWSALMTGLERNRANNLRPQIYVFNANTGNTGKSDNYRRMRFGLASSLVAGDVYFSFDYGSKDHAQVWWYDEYNVKLGDPTSDPAALNGGSKYTKDVWRRDYTHGLALVNATEQSQEVDLGGDYEKIIGQQDPTVNDGSIVNQVRLGARDGLIMLKTFQTIDNVVFGNGAFLRFFDVSGRRARNGFFAFEEGPAGGAKIWHGNLDSLPGQEKILATGLKLEIFNTYNDRWYNDFPLEGEKKGALRLAVGNLKGDENKEIVLASSASGKIAVLDYHGAILKNNFYPLDKKYKGGFSPAIGRLSAGAGGSLILGTGRGRVTEVLIYDAGYKLKKRFFPYDKKFTGGTNIAAGDVNGDGKSEIITVALVNKKALVRVFDGTGKKLSEFSAASVLASGEFTVAASDVNFDGKDEIVVMNGS